MGGSGAEGVYECRSCDELCSRSAQLLMSVSLPAMVTTLKHAPVPQKPHQLPCRFQNCTKAEIRIPDRSTIQAAPQVQILKHQGDAMMNPKWSISSRLNPNKKKLQETKCRTLVSAICEEGGPMFRLPVTELHKNQTREQSNNSSSAGFRNTKVMQCFPLRGEYLED